MASGTATPNYHGQLAANTVDTITMDRAWSSFKIVTDGSADIRYTVDGTDPQGSAGAVRVIPATVYEDSPPVDTEGPVVVRLWSAQTPQYSIVAVPDLGLPAPAGTSVQGLGDRMALYSGSPTLVNGPNVPIILDTEEWTPVGTTFAHDGNGVITVNNDCYLSVDAMIDYPDGTDSTDRGIQILFGGPAPVVEGAVEQIPAINGAHTVKSAHATCWMPAGATLTLLGFCGKSGGLNAVGEMEVLCLGHGS